MQWEGKDLIELKEPQNFNPPIEMVVWDYGHKDNLSTALVYAIIARPYGEARVITSHGPWRYCARFPEDEPKTVDDILNKFKALEDEYSDEYFKLTTKYSNERSKLMNKLKDIQIGI